jgi:hypothetical protein
MNSGDAESTSFLWDNNSWVANPNKKSTAVFGKGCVERRDITKKADDTTRTRAVEQRWI